MTYRCVFYSQEVVQVISRATPVYFPHTRLDKAESAGAGINGCAGITCHGK
jgi:hypothetical protein